MLYAPPVDGVAASRRRRPSRVERHRRLCATDYALAIANSSIATTRRTSARPTTTGPFSFTRRNSRDQFEVAFGRSMLFGNGLSALLTLMAHLGVARCAVRRWSARRGGWRTAPALAGLAGVLRRAWRGLHVDRGVHPAAIRPAARASRLFVDGHLFSLLLGTGLGAAWSRRLGDPDSRGHDRACSDCRPCAVCRWC